MKDNKEFIEGVYNKYEEYKKEIENTTNKNITKQPQIKNKKIIKIIGIAAVCAIVLSAGIVGENMLNQGKIKNESGQISKTKSSDKLSLKTLDNFDNFYKIAKENFKDNETSFLTNSELMSDADDITSSVTKSESSISSKETATTDTTSTEATSDYSKTNIQVENVDEADIVKTDGKYIYYVTDEKIIIVDINQKDDLSKVAEINYENKDFEPSELYINNDKLIVLGNENSYSYKDARTIKETTNSIYKKNVYKQKTVAIVYDMKNIENPKEERRVEIEGNYVSSRMINNNIYFVGNRTISTNNLLKEDEDKLDEDEYKPAYRDTAISTKEKLIDFDNIYYFENIETLNYLTLGGFNLDNTKEVDIQTFLGAGEDIYSSTENIYIVKTKHVYDADTYTNLGENTKILKFSLNNGKIKFKAEADIEGGINNQFSMDEYQGYFRIATTIGEVSWKLNEESSSNSIYILDENLKEVSRLDGIAKGEKIYSVRYSGNRAYVVTFKEMDPLFVIDLNNVNKPKILGELKIPGYSTYLHPYDENHLIGFGYDTKMNSSKDGVLKNGLKMSMFDITDLTNPKELFSTKIGDNNTSSELTDNHKALLFSKEKNIIAFPVQSYEKGERISKAQVYDIDLNKGFTLKGEIEHKLNKSKYYHEIEDENEVEDDRYYYGINDMKIERIIYSKDVFYTLSNSLIKATDMNTLKEITKIEL